MAPQHALTLSEAGYVLDRSTATINKAVDTGVIRARQRKVGKAVQRLLGSAELRFLRLSDELDRDLTPAGRRRLYDALRKLPTDAHRVELGEVDLDLARVDRDLKTRLARLDRVREGIDSREGQPEAVIRGTDIPAHLIAALAREQSVEEIAEDFPSLTPAQIKAAIEYAKAYPKRGRPYARRSLKRTLAEMVELGVFEDNGSVEDTAPRTLP